MFMARDELLWYFHHNEAVKAKKSQKDFRHDKGLAETFHLLYQLKEQVSLKDAGELHLN